MYHTGICVSRSTNITLSEERDEDNILVLQDLSITIPRAYEYYEGPDYAFYSVYFPELRSEECMSKSEFEAYFLIVHED